MSFALSLAAVDVLAPLLGVDPRRYPLEIPSVGVRAEDRVRIARAVFADLGGRGLVGADGVAPKVERALRAVAAPDVAVAVAGSLESGPLRARAAVLGGYAVLAVQEDQFVRFTPVEPSGLARAVVALLPTMPAGPGQSVRVHHRPPDEHPPGITEAVRAPRTPAQTQLRVAEEMLARPRTGVGLITITTRATDTATLTWLDTDAGRYLGLTRPDQDGVTYSPADGARLTHQLADLVQAAERLTCSGV